MKKKKKKVAVGMSGGVDSSVAAALLLKQGFEVIGVFMHFWTDPAQEKRGSSNKCCSVESFMDARRVCQKLDIPIYALNYSEKFKDKIVDNFIDEYKKGNTPNPCVLCNENIKLGGFVEQALDLGCDYVATGHYARISNEEGQSILKQGVDQKKDQSYFLYRLSQKQLQHMIFPLGELTKIQVRQLAKEFSLPVATKRDSQEICFVAGGTHNDFLKRHITQEEGMIVDKKGNMLGMHEGLAFYTIGQRKGLRLPGGPWYVVEKKQKENILVITNDPFDPDLNSQKVVIKSVNWTNQPPVKGKKYEARIRYMMQRKECEILQENGEYMAIFSQPMRSVSKGQSLVVYENDEVIGGGIIK